MNYSSWISIFYFIVFWEITELCTYEELKSKNGLQNELFLLNFEAEDKRNSERGNFMRKQEAKRKKDKFLEGKRGNQGKPAAWVFTNLVIALLTPKDTNLILAVFWSLLFIIGWEDLRKRTKGSAILCAFNSHNFSGIFSYHHFLKFNLPMTSYQSLGFERFWHIIFGPDIFEFYFHHGNRFDS